MTTQQVIALVVISAFVIGLFAYAYFLGRKAGRAHHQHGLLFDFQPRDASRVSTLGISQHSSTPEGCGHALAQERTEATPASLREAPSIDTQKTESLCCEAAGIIPPSSSPTKALIPHDKLREAALADATLIANNRPPAQPVKGYTPPSAAGCIVAAMDSMLAEQASIYATSESMAQAIEAALQQAGFLMPTDEACQAVRVRLDELVVGRETEQRKHHHIVDNLKRTITKLEEQILSYTGLAVTKSDYEQLTKAAETLQMAQRTWEAAKGTEPWCVRAHNGYLSIQSLARRIHVQLRNTPASTTKAGETA